MFSIDIAMNICLFFSTIFSIGILVLCFLMYRISESLWKIVYSHCGSVTAELIDYEAESCCDSDSDILETGLYRANQDDAIEYVNEKADELRLARISPYSNWDWSTDDSKEE